MAHLVEINSKTICECRGHPGLKRSCFICNFTSATVHGTNTHLFLIMSLISYYVTHLGIRGSLHIAGLMKEKLGG